MRDTLPNVYGVGGRGVEVIEGASFSAESCLIDGNTEFGVYSRDSATEVSLRDTIVSDTQMGANGEYGRGIELVNGPALTADGCLIDGNTGIGLGAFGQDTSVTLRESTISNTRLGVDLKSSAAFGVFAQAGSHIAASQLVVQSNQGPGLFVNFGASVECTGCTIEDNRFAGAGAIEGSTLSIIDLTIERTTASINLLGGAGVYAWPMNGNPPAVTLIRTLIQDNPVAGVWLIGNGTYVLTGNTISGGSGEAFGSGTRCGDSILALDGITAWGCDGMPEAYTEAPHADLCPFYSYPTCYAEFFFVAMPAEPVDEGDALRPDPVIRPSLDLVLPHGR